MNEINFELIEMTASIVKAYVGNNSVAVGDLASLIASIHAALAQLDGKPEAPPIAVPLVPAVSIRKSVTPDAIICLEDGKAFKSLKRHLGVLGMTPAQYRTKWGLPSDYPMVAPNYAEARSAMAKAIGLGRKVAPKAIAEYDAPPAKIKRARRAKAVA